MNKIFTSGIIKTSFLNLSLLVCFHTIYAQTAVTYSVAGVGQIFTVPPTVASIQVRAWGAAGGAYTPTPNIGGGGGFAGATFTVTPGETLTVDVGGGGVAGGGINGGGSSASGAGGGGMTDLRRGGTYLIIAGGGGGAGNGTGGGGGGLTGFDCTVCNIGGAASGSQTAGGAPQCPGATGGVSYQGGTGSQGGGGGGYYGGGGGSCGCGGGGGSGYIIPTATSTTLTMAPYVSWPTVGGVPANTSDFYYNGTAGYGNQGTAGNPGLLVIIFNGPILTATVSATNASCNGSCNGTAQLTNPSGGTAPYTYKWTPSGATTSSVAGLCAGNYTVTLTDATSISVTYSVGVAAPAVLSIGMTSSPEICTQSNGTAAANVSGGTGPYVYNWNNGQTKQTATGLIPGIYTATVTDNNGCSPVVGTATVVASTALPITLSKNVTVCAGTSTLLSAKGGTGYLWSTGATASSLTVAPAASTTYSVVISAGSCNKDTSIQVTTKTLPVITTGGNNPVCQGNSTTLSATGGNKYIWSTGTTGSAITVNPSLSTSYTVVVTNSLSCTANSIITLTVNPVPTVAISGLQSVCSGNTTQLSASGGTTYQWNTGQAGSVVTVNPSTTTGYTVTGTDNNNCTNTASTIITVNSLPLLTACCDVSITSGQSVTFTVTPTVGSNRYSWTPVTGLNSATMSNPTASPGTTTMYYVTVTDANGCQRMDSVLVTIKGKCGEVYIPNAFSPNGDHENDLLYIYTQNNCIQTMIFEIYDRWSNRIFLSVDPHAGWDGKYMGHECGDAVFLYSLRATLSDGTIIKKVGNVSLIR